MSVEPGDGPGSQEVGATRIAQTSVALLGGVGLLMIGTGLQGTVVGARGALEGFGTVAIGVVMSGYYVGYLLGSSRVPRLIAQVGHIRVFAALASTASAAMLAHLLVIHPVPWVMFRFVTGLCVAGVFVVAESWLNGQATARTRGHLLAVYMVVVLAGLLAGQLLVGLTGPGGFVGIVAASVLMSLGVVPVALTRQAGPAIAPTTTVSLRELAAIAPLALVGSLLSGAGAGALYGLSAVFAIQAGYSTLGISLFAGGAVAGALVLQLPVGRLSDRVDRRLVIVAAAAVAVVAAMGAILVPGDGFVHTFAAVALVGGMSLPLYALCLAHLADYLSSDDITAAGARLLFVQGVGAALGPIVAGALMAAIDVNGFFWFLAAVHLPIVVFGLWRISIRPAVAVADRADYVPLPSTLTPAGLDVLDDDPDGVPPAFPGELAVGDAVVHYRSRGEGDPVVFVHGSGESADVWEDAAAALARRGMRTVVVDLPGHGASQGPAPSRLDGYVASVAGVLESLGATDAVVVGRGAGVAVTVRLAVDHPSRLSRLVLVDPAWGLGPSGAAERVAGRAALVGDTAARRARRSPAASAAVAFRRAVLDSVLDRELARLGVPVVVLVAASDPVRGWSGTQRLRRGAPDATVLPVPGTRHRVDTNSAGFCATLGWVVLGSRASHGEVTD